MKEELELAIIRLKNLTDAIETMGWAENYLKFLKMEIENLERIVK